MNLSFRQLQTFREVMRAGSISGAARTLGRTQPAVSAMIAGLERELGFALFERRHGRLRPHPEAHYFLEEAEDVLTRLAQSAQTMREIGGCERGRLRIACNPATSAFFVPKVVAAFLKTRPQVRASLMMRSSAIVEEWIASQQYDVGLAEAPVARSSVEVRTFDMDCVCALRADDPLADAAVVTPTRLHGRPMAALFEQHATYLTTVQRFADAGAAFNQRFELRTFLPALQLVEAGLCACVCDRASALSYLDHRGASSQLVFRRFEPAVPLPLALLTPAHRPPSLLARSFCELLARELALLTTEFERQAAGRWVRMCKPR